MILRLPGLVFVLSAAGCGDEVATQVLVRLEADANVIAVGNRLGVQVMDANRVATLHEQTVELRPAENPPRFPFTVPLIPKGGDADRRYHVEAVVTDGHHVSSRRPDDLPAFAHALMQALDARRSAR